MADPNETNEGRSEELSTDELKSVSGGMKDVDVAEESVIFKGINRNEFRKSPEGSGSGKTLKDWKKGDSFEEIKVT